CVSVTRMPTRRCARHRHFLSENRAFGIQGWYWAARLALGVSIPVQNLQTVPMQHALESSCVFIDRFEVCDSVWLAADVGMDGERHDLGALLALEVKPVELVDGTLEQVLTFVVLHDHHRDIVELDRIGQGYQRSGCGPDCGRLVVVDP